MNTYLVGYVIEHKDSPQPRNVDSFLIDAENMTKEKLVELRDTAIDLALQKHYCSDPSQISATIISVSKLGEV